MSERLSVSRGRRVCTALAGRIWRYGRRWRPWVAGVMRELVEVVEDDGDGGEVFGEPGEVAPADDVAGSGSAGFLCGRGHVMGTS